MAAKTWEQKKIKCKKRNKRRKFQTNSDNLTLKYIFKITLKVDNLM